jgi:hypothetical protein
MNTPQIAFYALPGTQEPEPSLAEDLIGIVADHPVAIAVIFLVAAAAVRFYMDFRARRRKPSRRP